MDLIVKEDYIPDVSIIKEIVEENIGRPLELSDLEQWKIPSGGGLSFQSTMDMEEKEIECLILAKRKEKRYYERGQDDEDSSPIPDCRSEDMKQGIGNPGMLCSECPHNTFINGRKECQDRMTVIFLKKGDLIPSFISLPVMSIRPFEKFLMHLTSKGMLYKNQIVKLSLEKVKNSKNISYSRLKVELVGSISGHEETVKALQITL